MRKGEKIFIKKAIAAAIMLIMVLVTLFASLHYRKYHWVDRGDLIAEVSGVKIYRKDVEIFMSSIAEKPQIVDLKIETMGSKILEAVLVEIYLNRMIYKLAQKKHLTTYRDVKFSVQEYREKLVRDKFLNEKIFAEISEKDLLERYHQLAEAVEGMEERKISHIVVKTEEEAERIRNMIIRFNNFEIMAEQKSIDAESASDGGSLGYVIKERIDIPEFAEVAFLLKIGEISRPIETKNGWHIVRVDDVRNVKIKTYEESKNEILEQLKQEKFDSLVDKIVHRPKIKIFVRSEKTDQTVTNENNASTVQDNKSQSIPEIKDNAGTSNDVAPDEVPGGEDDFHYDLPNNNEEQHSNDD
ncbi:MAG: peptidylprolyl isomerase [Rickettsiales bacterium]|jgi:hypothetical protein|nr:peptidylprolyl isomerase [Rickettsiales bacterium]